MRRLASRAALTALVGIMTLLGAPAAGASARDCGNPDGCVLAISVNGLIDPVVADFMVDAIDAVADADGYHAVVVILDSEGSVVDDDELIDIATTMTESPVPVSVWIGPSGARALGGAAELALASGNVTMAPDTRIGDVGDQRLPDDTFPDLSVAPYSTMRGQSIDAEEAAATEVTNGVDALLGDHVLELDGVPSEQITDDDGRPKRTLLVDAVQQTIPITSQIFHTVASPAVAYLAFGIAIGLLLFEFFTAGIGVAGVVGAGSAVLAGYGLDVLPARPWAIALGLFAGLAFAIDIQVGIPRFWTGVGVVAWTVSSVFLYDGMRVPWIALVSGLVGMWVAMLSGMPSMVRARFATPTIGRDWMLGSEGVTRSEVDPEGIVEIDGARWRALTHRLTPLGADEPCRVVAIDGMTLEIEPLEGGAVDYREMRGRRDESVRDS